MRPGGVELDGVAANFRCVLELEPLPLREYRRALKATDAALVRSPGEPRLLARRGKLLANLTRLPEARAALKAALAADPEALEARRWLAETALLERRIDEAAAQLERVLAREPADAWALFFRAACRTVSGDAAAAAEDLARAGSSGGPAAAAARALLGLLESNAGRGRRALETAARLPDRPWAAGLRGLILGRLGRPGEAVSAFDAALASGSAPAWIRAERSALLTPVLLDRGDLAGAERALDEAAALGLPWDARRTWAFRLALALRRSGRGDRAAALLNRLRRERPRDGALSLALARELDLLGRNAAAELERASRLLMGANTADAELCVSLSELLTKHGRLSAAEAAARRAAAAAPDGDEPALQLAAVLSLRGRARAAAAVLDGASRRRPASEKVRLARTELLVQDGRLAEAWRCLDAAPAPRPESIRRRRELLLGELRARGHDDMIQGRYAASRRLLVLVLEEAPRDAEAWFFQGKLERFSHRFAAAAAAYRRACGLEPGRLRNYLYLAECEMKAGRAPAGLAALARARRRCPVPPRGDVEGWIERYRLAGCSLDFLEAERIGEALLARSPRTERIVRSVAWLVFHEEFHLFKRPASYLAAVERALARHERLRPRSPWPSYFRVLLLRTSGLPGIAERLERDCARLRAADARRYRWMRLEAGLFARERGDLETARADAAAARADGLELVV